MNYQSPFSQIFGYESWIRNPEAELFDSIIPARQYRILYLQYASEKNRFEICSLFFVLGTSQLQQS